MAIAEQFLTRLDQLGFKEYILPFLLVWILLYGILKKVNIFDETANIDEVLSIIGALLVVTYTPFVEGVFQVYVTNLFGAIAILLIAMFGFFLLVGMMLGDEGEDIIQRHKEKVFGAIGLAVIFLFISYGGPRMILSPQQLEALGLSSYGEAVFLSRADMYLLLIVAGIVAFMYWTMGGSLLGRNGHWVKKHNGEILDSTSRKGKARTWKRNDDFEVSWNGKGPDPLEHE